VAEEAPCREAMGKVARTWWLGISLPGICGGPGLPLSCLGLVFEEVGGGRIAPA